MKRLLSGNEAIALGAYHAGVSVAAAYPGTPSTEILEVLASFNGVYAEWSTNEKVAMEVALGASYGGVRAMASMKHVGLNVAADPFFAASVTGINGGLVVVSADDPGMHSSQNEQDNRHYSRFAKVPMVEPSDSQEAYDLMAVVFKMSEEYDTPVLVRTTTRISHCKSVVDVKEDIVPSRNKPRFIRNPQKYVMVPSNARPKHPLMEERIIKLKKIAEVFRFNEVITGSGSIGVIASGAAYQYAREVFPDASFLKLVMTYPLPDDLIKKFSKKVRKLIVVEELDPFLEEHIKTLGIEISGKKYFPIIGEFSAEVIEDSAVKAGLILAKEQKQDGEGNYKLPSRPPILCPGCPHTALSFALRRLGFYHAIADRSPPEEQRPLVALKKQGIIATSDIGCYTLAVYAPLLALDTCACMGASIGQAHGLEKAGIKNRTVAVIGDSTFMHSGVTPLMDVVYNRGNTTVIILDNNTTAMTGHQGHPGTGISAKGEKLVAIKLEELCRGIGVKDVNVVDAFSLSKVEETLKKCVEMEEPSVIIVRGSCPLLVRVQGTALKVDAEKCDSCYTCIRLGCPAIGRAADKVVIEETLCIGNSCGLCRQVCPKEAIRQ